MNKCPKHYHCPRQPLSLGRHFQWKRTEQFLGDISNFGPRCYTYYKTIEQGLLGGRKEKGNHLLLIILILISSNLTVFLIKCLEKRKVKERLKRGEEKAYRREGDI